MPVPSVASVTRVQEDSETFPGRIEIFEKERERTKRKEEEERRGTPDPPRIVLINGRSKSIRYVK